MLGRGVAPRHRTCGCCAAWHACAGAWAPA